MVGFEVGGSAESDGLTHPAEARLHDIGVFCTAGRRRDGYIPSES